MEHQKIINLLNEVSDSVPENGMTINQSKGNYDVGNKIIYNMEVLKSKITMMFTC